ncbi:MAG: hypothetical protein ACKVQW_05320, partial [Pyrinomonadaceae bacterium]
RLQRLQTTQLAMWSDPESGCRKTSRDPEFSTLDWHRKGEQLILTGNCILVWYYFRGGLHDDRTDFAVFSPTGGLWQIYNSNDEIYTFDNWGTSGDIPVPSAFNR